MTPFGQIERPKTDPMNALEPWVIVDSVLIGTGQSDFEGWFESFATLSVAHEIPFFNVRNRSMVDVCYCNQDTQDFIPYVFHAYSLGIEFFGMPFSDAGAWDGVNLGWLPVTYSENYAIFTGDLPRHAGLTFKVMQDEKLVNTCTATPSGAGMAGVGRSLYIGTGVPPVFLGTFQNLTIGVPGVQNRWMWVDPIQIPRGTNINLTLNFSEIARYMLAAMAGPGSFYLANTVAAPELNAVVGIRASLKGIREVQRRNALHY